MRKNVFRKLIIGNKAALFVVLLVIILSFSTEFFLTSTNLFNVLRQVTISTVVALGFTLVLGAGQIDLSIGSIVGLTGVIMGKLMVAGVPTYLAIFIGILFGALCGALNATIVSMFSLPSFIVTLATAALFRGTIYIITNMIPVRDFPANFLFLGQGYWGRVPIPVIITAVMIVIMYLVANRTKFGRYVVAMGGNLETTRTCGVNIPLVRLGVFMTSGMCAALSSVILTARTASAQINGGLNMEMDVIAAVVIGGTALYGGNINIIGTVFGVLIIGIVSNGLNLIGVNTNYQIIAKGLLILMALIIDYLSTRFFVNLSKRQLLRGQEEISRGTR